MREPRAAVVHVGEPFTFEAELPYGGDGTAEAVPMGLPVEEGGGAPVPAGLPVHAAPTPPAAPPPPRAPPPAAARAATNAAAEGTSNLGAAVTAMGLARELGVKPSDAVSAARDGAKLANELGVTPREALSAGIAGMKLLAAAKRSGLR